MKKYTFIAIIIVVIFLGSLPSTFVSSQTILPTPTPPNEIPSIPDDSPLITNAIPQADSQYMELLGTYDTPGYTYGVDIVGNYAYLADGNCLRIINITNPNSPWQVGFLPLIGIVGIAEDVVVTGNYAYIAATYSGVYIVNIMNPSAPSLAAIFPTFGIAHNLTVVGKYAYVAGGLSGIEIIDITNPNQPFRAGFLDTPDNAYGITVVGKYAYVADGMSGLQIIDISVPSSPTRIGSILTSGFAYGVTVSRAYAYVGAYSGGLRIINITDPSQPKEVGYTLTYGLAQNISLLGDYAYLGDGDTGLKVINIANPKSPYEAGYYNFPAGTHTRDTAISGDRIYAATGIGGLAILHFLEPTLVYEGPLFLPAKSLMVDEVDEKVSVGDHVHLRLPFRNIGTKSMVDAVITLDANPGSAVSPHAFIYTGGQWSENPLTLTLSPATILPGETGFADFWIYISNEYPSQRNSIFTQAIIQIRSGSGEWIIQINIDPISFPADGQHSLLASSCLHNPDNIDIEKYAQYAAASNTIGSIPSNVGDPDTAGQVIQNLSKRLNQEYGYRDNDESDRVPDVVLLTRRLSKIGQCRHFSDLTAGLLRSLDMPSRIVSSKFLVPGYIFPKSHMWVEAYFGSAQGWKQVDSTNGIANDNTYYEDQGITVKDTWAEKFPLTSATSYSGIQYLCIQPCYLDPINCPKCQRESQIWRLPFNPDLSCVDNVTNNYHAVTASLQAVPISINQMSPISIDFQAPVYVTETLPTTVSTGITNISTSALGPITTTIPIQEYLNSETNLYDVTPAYQVISNLNPSQGITLTWVVTPLVGERTAPLGLAVLGENLFTYAEQPININGYNTLPNLNLVNGCGLDNIQPGQSIPLTVSVLDEQLIPLTDATTEITATIESTPTVGYFNTVSLAYCESCQAFQYLLTMPLNAPTGTYRVVFTASKSGYQSDQLESSFTVIPVINLTVNLSHYLVDPLDAVIVSAQVLDRGFIVDDAGVRAQIVTPSGSLTAPLSYEPTGRYFLAFRPIELASDLGGTIIPGKWTIQVMVNYQGVNTSVQKEIIVKYKVFVPAIRR